MKHIHIFENFSDIQAWFADSQVVDLAGRPLRLYHGTNTYFDEFDSNTINTVEPRGDYIGHGYYFTSVRNRAIQFAQQAVETKGGEIRIVEAYLRITNPLKIEKESDGIDLRDSFGGSMKYHMLMKSNPYSVREELQRRGYDGLIDLMYQQYAVFTSSQIKIINS